MVVERRVFILARSDFCDGFLFAFSPVDDLILEDLVGRAEPVAVEDINEVDITGFNNVESEVSFELLLGYRFQAHILRLLFLKVLILDSFNLALSHNTLVFLRIRR